MAIAEAKRARELGPLSAEVNGPVQESAVTSSAATLATEIQAIQHHYPRYGAGWDPMTWRKLVGGYSSLR